MRAPGIVGAIASCLLLVGCGGGAAGAANSTPEPAPSAPASPSAAPSSAAPAPTPAPSSPPPATGPFGLAVNVPNGAKGVPVDTLITVTPQFGKVESVTVSTTASGKSTVPKIGGDVNDQGAWVAASRLDPSASYTVTASGVGNDGSRKTEKVQFNTAALSRSMEVFPTLTPVQGGPFGVAQPVVIQFDHPVANKAEFERNLRVTSIPAQEGSWGWIDDKTVHYRPKDYWQPGTEVNLDANLNGVNAGNGFYGQESRTLKLKIGRKQVGRVDISGHKISWETDGQPAKSYPMSAGKEGFTTRSGTKVVMEKAENIKMESETTGISRDSAEGYSVKVAYALRVTSSGEFIHSAPWNEGKFGRVNASHGCVGLSEEQMYSLYEQAQIGDPVVFTGSDRPTEFGNGWSAWDESWDKWRTHSALK
ncbi:L,D-transpeptidase family protein [Naumannella sp. ID2617S]|nr:L,D-transpeptidase family protein [Naumannella sp. ID2617S]